MTVVGQVPADEDEEFVGHRSNFIVSDLIAFNELREVRKLRKRIVESQAKADHTPGLMTKYDLMPEYTALDECMRTLHKKLRID